MQGNAEVGLTTLLLRLVERQSSPCCGFTLIRPFAKQASKQCMGFMMPGYNVPDDCPKGGVNFVLSEIIGVDVRGPPQMEVV